MKKFTVKLNDYTCSAELRRYADKSKNICLILNDIQDGLRVANATVNYDNVTVPEEHILVKDYAENTGMYSALIKANIIEPGIVENVNRDVYLVRLTKDFIEEHKNFFSKPISKRTKKRISDELFDGSRLS